jgi:hypothetical protein
MSYKIKIPKPTPIHGNCTDGNSRHYGLEVSGASSEVQIISPLRTIFKWNKAGGN